MSKGLFFAKSASNYLVFQFTNEYSDEFYEEVCKQMGIEFEVHYPSRFYPRDPWDAWLLSVEGVVKFNDVSRKVKIDDYVVVKLDDEASSLEVLNPELFDLKYDVKE